MAQKGLKKWVGEKWVDIATQNTNVIFYAYTKRGKYPKCVPLAKARSMSAGKRRAAVKRKQSKDNTSKGKPGYAKT